MVTAAAGLLAGCGSSGGNGSSGGKVKIVWWFNDKNQQPALEQIAKDFMKQNPNITVDAELQNGQTYYTQLQTVLAAHNGPDVFWMNGPNFLGFETKGFFAPLNVNLNWSNYPKNLVGMYTVNGTHYAVPKDYDTIGLFYNKTLFDKAHIPYPTNNWTWDDVRAAAKKLTIAGKQWGIADENSSQEVEYPLMVSAGSQIISKDKKSVDVDSASSLKAIQFLYDLMYVDKSAPTGQWQTDNDPYQAFMSGKIAMITAGDWNAHPFYQALGSKVGVVKFPKFDGNSGNIIHGIGWVVNANSKQKAADMKFEEYLGSKAAALTQADTGTVIPAYNGTQEPWVKSMKGFSNLQIFLDQAKYATAYPTGPNAQWENALTTHFTNIWLNKETPQQGLKAAQQEADQALQSSN